MTTATRVRRTQAERTASTRQALLDSTLECLMDVGYRGTTTLEVTSRAGLSLGALLHHFPTKEDLLVAAIRHLMERRQREFAERMAQIDPGTNPIDAAVDALWDIFSGSSFVAWLELWVAARTDPALAEALVALDREFLRASQEIFEGLFPSDEVEGGDDFYDFGLSVVYAVMDGLALGRLQKGYEPHHVDHVLELLKQLGRLVIVPADRR
jgi:AcrR family transcriptional regulator